MIYKLLLYGAIIAGILAAGATGGWKARDVIADRDAAQAQSMHDAYVLSVVEDAARANAEALAEKERLSALLSMLANKNVELAKERTGISLENTKGLSYAQATGVGEDAIGPALSEYLDRVRQLQHSRSDN